MVYQDEFSEIVIPYSSLEIISEATPLITPDASIITIKEIEKELDNFKEFLTKNYFNLHNCKCCSGEFTSIDIKYWHTFSCSQCSVPPKVCIDCYNKMIISRSGHQLNPQSSGISCMQCNFVFVASPRSPLSAGYRSTFF